MLKTGISSIFSEALYSPYFLISGILAVPLFFMVYLYGRDFVERLGWNNRNYESQIGFWGGLAIALWLMLFGGNYDVVVIHGVSLLPIGMALVLFLLMSMISQKLVQLHYLEKINKKSVKWALFLGLLLITISSAMPTWHGILLQISAVFCGLIVGCRMKKNINVVPMLTIILVMILMLMLMQTEFFRLGKIGNFPFVYFLGLAVTGFLGTSVFVSRYAKARGCINKNLFVKIKWLLRVILLLLLALFIKFQLFVLVYILLLAFLVFHQWLMIRFSDNKPANLSGQLFGLFLISFGIVIICPLISALGIIYMIFCPGRIKFKDVLSLL